MKKLVAATLLGAACLTLSAPAEAGPRFERWRAHHPEKAERIEKIRKIAGPIREMIRNGERPSVSVGASVQVGSSRPVEIQQDADVNVGAVVQIGETGPARLEQSGIVNFGRVIQRD